jgi:hypothetical protein
MEVGGRFFDIEGEVVETIGGSARAAVGSGAIDRRFAYIERGFVEVSFGFVEIERGFVEIERSFVEAECRRFGSPGGFVHMEAGSVEPRGRPSKLGVTFRRAGAGSLVSGPSIFALIDRRQATGDRGPAMEGPLRHSPQSKTEQPLPVHHPNLVCVSPVLDGLTVPVSVAADLKRHGPRQGHANVGREPVVHSRERMLPLPQARDRRDGSEDRPRIWPRAEQGADQVGRP